jgi:acetyl-CoA C-acetyltransferase
MLRTDYDFTHIEDSYRVGCKAYEVAGIRNPREEISMAEVDDGTSIAEAVSLEDLQISPRGRVKEDIEARLFYLEGKLPVQPDGGEKCCGHPIAATGLRQVYEICLQLQGRAGPRQIKNPKLGLIHSIGSTLEPTVANAGCCVLSL